MFMQTHVKQTLFAVACIAIGPSFVYAAYDGKQERSRGIE